MPEEVLVCNLQADTWQWPNYLDERMDGECSVCHSPIFYEKKNAAYRKVCAPCWMKMFEKGQSKQKPVMSSWTVYFNPRDCPGKYVVRRFDIYGGREPQPTTEHYVGASLAEVREHIPPGLVNVGRYNEDEAQIVETWL